MPAEAMQLSHEGEDFEAPEQTPDLKLVRDETEEESPSETGLETAIANFETANEESLADEMTALHQAIVDRYKLEETKGRAEVFVENLRTGLEKFSDKKLFKVFGTTVTGGDAINMVLTSAIGRYAMPVIKHSLLATTHIHGALAAVLIGGAVGGVRSGLRASKMVEKEYLSGAGWEAKIDATEDPQAKLEMIKFLLSDPDAKKYFKGKAQEAWALLSKYQTISAGIETQEFIKLAPEEPIDQLNPTALEAIAAHLKDKSAEQRGAFVKAFGRGAVRGAIFAAAFYGLGQLIGGTPAHAEGNTHPASDGPLPHGANAPGAGDSNLPEAPNAPGAETLHHNPLEWRHDSGATHARLEFDADKGQFVDEPGQSVHVDVDSGGSDHQIARIIVESITHSAKEVGTEAHFDIGPVHQHALEDNIVRYLASHPHQGADVDIPADEINNLMHQSGIYIQTDGVLNPQNHPYYHNNQIHQPDGNHGGAQEHNAKTPDHTKHTEKAPNAATTKAPPAEGNDQSPPAKGELEAPKPPIAPATSQPAVSGESAAPAAHEPTTETNPRTGAKIAVGTTAAIALLCLTPWGRPLIQKAIKGVGKGLNKLGKLREPKEEARTAKIEEACTALEGAIEKFSTLSEKDLVQTLADVAKGLKRSKIYDDEDGRKIDSLLGQFAEELGKRGTFQENGKGYKKTEKAYKDARMSQRYTVVGADSGGGGQIYINSDYNKRHWTPEEFLNEVDLSSFKRVGENTPPTDATGPDLDLDDLDDTFDLGAPPTYPPAAPAAPTPPPPVPEPKPESDYEIGGQSAREVNDQLYNAEARNNLDLARAISRAIQEKFANGYDLVMTGISGVKSKLTGFTIEDEIIRQYQMQSEEDPEYNFLESQRGIQRASKSFDFEERTAPTPDIPKNSELMAEFDSYVEVSESLFIAAQEYRNFALTNKGVFTSFKESTTPGSYIAKSIIPESKDAAWTPEKKYNAREFLELVDGLQNVNYTVHVDLDSAINPGAPPVSLPLDDFDWLERRDKPAASATEPTQLTEAELREHNHDRALAEQKKYIDGVIKRAAEDSPEQLPVVKEAIDAAVAGREVLLIDSNWQHSGVANLFEVHPPRGLADVLSGHAALDEVIKDTEIPGLRIVATGDITLKPVEPDEEQPGGFEPKKQLERILSRAKDIADDVFYTSPPTLPNFTEQNQNSFERALAEFDGYEAYSDFADQSPTLDDMSKEYEDFVLLTTDKNGKTIAARQYIVIQKNPYKFLEKTIDSTTHIYAVSRQDWVTQLPGVICKVNPASKINAEPAPSPTGPAPAAMDPDGRFGPPTEPPADPVESGPTQAEIDKIIDGAFGKNHERFRGSLAEAIAGPDNAIIIARSQDQPAEIFYIGASRDDMRELDLVAATGEVTNASYEPHEAIAQRLAGKDLEIFIRSKPKELGEGEMFVKAALARIDHLSREYSATYPSDRDRAELAKQEIEELVKPLIGQKMKLSEKGQRLYANKSGADLTGEFIVSNVIFSETPDPAPYIELRQEQTGEKILFSGYGGFNEHLIYDQSAVLKMPAPVPPIEADVENLVKQTLGEDMMPFVGNVADAISQYDNFVIISKPNGKPAAQFHITIANTKRTGVKIESMNITKNDKFFSGGEQTKISVENLIKRYNGEMDIYIKPDSKIGVKSENASNGSV